MKSRGRPKGPEKVVCKFYATPDVAIGIADALKLARQSATYAEFEKKLREFLGCAASVVPPSFDEAVKELDAGKAERHGPCAFDDAREKVFSVHSEAFWKLRVSELEDKVKELEGRVPNTNDSRNLAALLDDIQKLTDQVAGLEMELEEARSLDQDGRVAFWKGELAKLREEVRRKGDLSQ